MKIHDVAQGTPEWLALRAGIPTASELGSLITDAGKLREWKTETPNTYLYTKLSERWQGYPLQSYSGGSMEQGSILEDEAIPWYEATYGVDIARPGFITNDYGSFGCSPDGLLACSGLEIKCPEPPNHTKWLDRGECPPEHVLQCQGGMYVTGYDSWTFLSYRRGFPALVVPVQRDDKLIHTIEEAIYGFIDRMDAAWDRMVERNGGEPPKRKTPKTVVRDEDPFGTREYEGNMTYEQ